MARPRILPALTWPKYENAVLDVFIEALNRLGQENSLPQGEEPINFQLYWKCREVHHERLQAKMSIPFVIDFDSTNQPEPDDTSESRRLKKRPDFSCALTDEQATDYRKSQVRYSLECKRLGAASGQWIFTENYSERGMLRFRQTDHSYAKGCSSAAMIGYVQNMTDDELLKEVNEHATTRKIPSLTKAATAWAAKSVTQLGQAPLDRDFDPAPVQLGHLWLDLRHCVFTLPPVKPATAKKKAARKKSKKSMKNTAKKAA
jgi:hypothetical protein